jgi:hypothetical protein
MTNNVMMAVRNGASDNELSKMVIKNLPDEVYNSVEVHSREHSFVDAGAISSRLITLRPTGKIFEQFMNDIRAVLWGFPTRPTFNATAISYYILGVDQDSESNKKAEEELRIAFEQHRIINLFVSNDLKYLECVIQDNRGVCPIL